jgi:3-dehydroquinate dehydratase-2
MKIIIINGPNLNLLGKREEKHYGALTLDKIKKIITDEFAEIDFTFFQSNIEGEIINAIQGAPGNYDGILINPGGYAHTSVAIRDALADCKIPKVEVHLSHLVNRENFRQSLITASGCDGYISGFKEISYISGIYALKHLIYNEGN